MTINNREVFSDRAISIFAIVFILSILFIGALEYFTGTGRKEILDYLSYSLPCISGVVAGGAILSSGKKSDRLIFISAVGFLILGFICYLGAQGTHARIYLVWIAFVSACCVVFLSAIAIRKNYTGNSEGLWGTIIIVLMAILVAVELGMVLKHWGEL